MNSGQNSSLTLDTSPLSLETVKDYIFSRKSLSTKINLTDATKTKVYRAHQHLLNLLEKRVPIYGVTTGFGDSSFRFTEPYQAEELQRNLVAYLTCGTGPTVPEIATRATMLIRLNSLARGYSGVSIELLERLKLFLENRWTPLTPREGSLGASGDLIPLAYLAAAIQGQGMLHHPDSPQGKPASEILAEAKVPQYTLKPKEGLALVNGTSSMAGLSLINLNHAHFIVNLTTLTTSWLCMALQGRTEAFDVLVNEKAKLHQGQARVAKAIRENLIQEGYRNSTEKNAPVQDRYSLRCTPQILGPALETIELGWNWLELELNSASDNPLISEEGNLSTGGNFYGGYLAHSQDYLKICLANTADLLDRQLMLLADEKTNRGLPPNLADWPNIPESSRFLHHGLKALHQSVSAITSEIMAKAIPNSIFSRSSECHNQDKVSLGMSAAVQCSELIEQLFNVQSMILICFAQALDLRGITLKGALSREIYQLIRATIPRIESDRALGPAIQSLASQLKTLSYQRGEKVATV